MQKRIFLPILLGLLLGTSGAAAQTTPSQMSVEPAATAHLLTESSADGVVANPPSVAAAPPGPCPDEAKRDKSKPPECIVFRLAKDVIPKSSVQLFNGYQVDAEDWPALALAAFDYINNLNRPDTFTCTATLLGPRVLLTAAHCVDMDRTDKFRTAHLVAGTRDIKVSCDPDERYFKPDPQTQASRSSYDFALCELSWEGPTTPVPLTEIIYETLDVKTKLQRNDPVVLTGYGCASMSIVEHAYIEFVSNPKVLRVGGDVIELTRNEEPNSPATVRTRSATGKEPALCKGDSGGPMMTGIKIVEPTVQGGLASVQITGLRRVRAVNATVDFDRPTPTTENFLSRMAALEGTGFDEYVKKWRKKHKVAKICGWDEDATSCQE